MLATYPAFRFVSSPIGGTFMLRPLVPLLRPLALPLSHPSASACGFCLGFLPRDGSLGFESYVCVYIVVLSFLGYGEERNDLRGYSHSPELSLLVDLMSKGDSRVGSAAPRCRLHQLAESGVFVWEVARLFVC